MTQHKDQPIEKPTTEAQADQPLPDAALDHVNGGASYTETLQMISNMLKTIQDTQKTIVNNIRG